MDVTVTGNDVSKEILKGVMDLSEGKDEAKTQEKLDSIFKGSSITFWTSDKFSEGIKKFVKEEDMNKTTVYTSILEEFLQVLCLVSSVYDAKSMVKLARMLQQFKIEIMLGVLKKYLGKS